MKNEEWVRLTERFNAQATNCRRTPQQLRLKWENLIKNSRKRSTKGSARRLTFTAGPYLTKPDDEPDRDVALAASADVITERDFVLLLISLYRDYLLYQA
ncbi:unnamed protein product [Colias eurytheme]|nr:unnamed protein product [Colias eurytheme]